MEKTLKTIQILSKIARIISKIIFIITLVCAIICLAGIFMLALAQSIPSINIDSIVSNATGADIAVAYFSCFVGVIACVFECILAKFAEIYFKNEIAAGTPFTYEGSKEILRLGILALALPLGSSIISSIVHGIFSLFSVAVRNMPLDSSASLDMGIVFILASFIFKYGADIIANAKSKEE